MSSRLEDRREDAAGENDAAGGEGGLQADDPERLVRERCARCALQLRWCLCAELRPIALATRVVVLRHRKEAHRTSNTGRLVPLTLIDGHVRVVGGRGAKIDAADLVDSARRVVLLFPTPDSRELTRDDVDPRPLTLLVPDSTWRRAFKMTTREPALADLPRVHVPLGAPSIYRLRRHPDPRFLATFESIARALGILEGAAVQRRLEDVFALLVERTLASRGATRR